MGNIKPGMMKYGVIGNIAKEHIDENGVLRYGTVCIPGGRKVYISRRLWKPGAVSIMGLMNDTGHQVQLLIDEDVLKDVKI